MIEIARSVFDGNGTVHQCRYGSMGKKVLALFQWLTWADQGGPSRNVAPTHHTTTTHTHKHTHACSTVKGRGLQENLEKQAYVGPPNFRINFILNLQRDPMRTSYHLFFWLI